MPCRPFTYDHKEHAIAHNDPVFTKPDGLIYDVERHYDCDERAEHWHAHGYRDSYHCHVAARPRPEHVDNDIDPHYVDILAARAIRNLAKHGDDTPDLNRYLDSIAEALAPRVTRINTLAAIRAEFDRRTT